MNSIVASIYPRVRYPFAKIKPEDACRLYGPTAFVVIISVLLVGCSQPDEPPEGEKVIAEVERESRAPVHSSFLTEGSPVAINGHPGSVVLATPTEVRVYMEPGGEYQTVANLRGEFLQAGASPGAALYPSLPRSTSWHNWNILWSCRPAPLSACATAMAEAAKPPLH